MRNLHPRGFIGIEILVATVLPAISFALAGWAVTSFVVRATPNDERDRVIEDPDHRVFGGLGSPRARPSRTTP